MKELKFALAGFILALVITIPALFTEVVLAQNVTDTKESRQEDIKDTREIKPERRYIIEDTKEIKTEPQGQKEAVQPGDKEKTAQKRRKLLKGTLKRKYEMRKLRQDRIEKVRKKGIATRGKAEEIQKHPKPVTEKKPVKAKLKRFPYEDKDLLPRY